MKIYKRLNNDNPILEQFESKELQEYFSKGNVEFDMQNLINIIMSIYKGFDDIPLDCRRRKKNLQKAIKKILQWSLSLQNEIKVILEVK